jgi:undecaprenyl diphosphate synthase
MTLCLEKTSNSSTNNRIKKSFPSHIAIIMDGNRRWAEKKGLPLQMGHWKGAEAIDKVVEAAKDLKVKTLTLFAFSTENWNRSEKELKALMELFSFFLKRRKKILIHQGVKFSTIGDLTPFSDDLKKLIVEVKQATTHGKALELVIALNYGSRDEILRGFKKLIDDIESKKISKQEVTENLFSEYLDTCHWQDPDLLIRTSGEKRVSNFLLWQISYAEFFVTETLWPDFSKEELCKAIEEYENRQRRFGE